MDYLVTSTRGREGSFEARFLGGDNFLAEMECNVVYDRHSLSYLFGSNR